MPYMTAYSGTDPLPVNHKRMLIATSAIGSERTHEQIYARLRQRAADMGISILVNQSTGTISPLPALPYPSATLNIY